MEQIDNVHTSDSYKKFCEKIAKRWQSYSTYEFIQGIKLSQSQANAVEYNADHMLIYGSAGSGKSYVLLYRMINSLLEEKEKQNVLYLTFNKILIDDTYKRCARMDGFDELRKKHNIEIKTFHQFAFEQLRITENLNIRNNGVDFSRVKKEVDDAFRRVAIALDTTTSDDCYNNLSSDEKLFSTHDERFVRDEILWMKANGFVNLEEYASNNCKRSGRGYIPRLTIKQRPIIFRIFEEYEKIRKNNDYQLYMDLEDYALYLLGVIQSDPELIRYDYIYIDEVQDFDAMQLKLLASICSKNLVMAGDAKQRIYKNNPHSYDSLGIKITNSQRTLNENYRSTKEIMKLANSLNIEDSFKDSKRVKYMNSGEKPKIIRRGNYDKLVKYLVDRTKEIQSKNIKSSIVIINREDNSVNKGVKSDIKLAIESKGIQCNNIKEYKKRFKIDGEKQVYYSDAYNIKGLEFDYVFIIQFDKMHYPLRSNLDSISRYKAKNQNIESNEYEKDIQEIIQKEKKLLYVAMSRAKEGLELLFTGKDYTYASEFIADFDKKDYIKKG